MVCDNLKIWKWSPPPCPITDLCVWEWEAISDRHCTYMYYDTDSDMVCVLIAAHTVNEPPAATNDSMNSSNAVHHPPPRPPPARPHSAPDTHPEAPGRPSQPPSRPSPLPPKHSPVHQSSPQSQQHSHNQSRCQQGMPATAQAGSSGGGLFSSLRGGAGNFLKNLKDTTGKVMQTVQQWVLCGRSITIGLCLRCLWVRIVRWWWHRLLRHPDKCTRF